MTQQTEAAQAEEGRTRPEVATRVGELLASMTTAEKVELVTGDLNFNFGYYSAPIERVGIPALTSRLRMA